MTFTPKPLILFDPLTTSLIYLLRVKANDGLDCLARGFDDLAEERYTESEGAIELWEAVFEKPLSDLSRPERAYVDEQVRQDMKRLDDAILTYHEQTLEEVAP